LGLILRQIVDRKLCREIGFSSFDRYAEEGADLSARTARRCVRLARLGAAHPAAATAFREGTLTERQTELVTQASGPDASGAWVTFAQGVTLRRLEEEAAPLAARTSRGTARHSVHSITFEASTRARCAARAARQRGSREDLQLARRIIATSPNPFFALYAALKAGAFLPSVALPILMWGLLRA
jgi:hypothetical protein